MHGEHNMNIKMLNMLNATVSIRSITKLSNMEAAQPLHAPCVPLAMAERPGRVKGVCMNYLPEIAPAQGAGVLLDWEHVNIPSHLLHGPRAS